MEDHTLCLPARTPVRCGSGIVDISRGTLEVYREPSPEGYRSRVVLGSGDTVSPLACPGVTVAVADLLP